MLHKETVDINTLELILKLQSDSALEGFILVGGTALALQIGHRTSVDIDFFTKEEFDNQQMLEHLEKNYGFQEQYRHHNTLKGIINGIFVDLIRHEYNFISKIIDVEGVKMASLQDIAAMKVNAISGNGTRIKDFIDIYFLLKEYSFEEIIGFYKTKYNTRNDFHAVKSLSFFDDLLVDEWPQMLLEKNISLNEIEKEILVKRDHFLKK